MNTYLAGLIAISSVVGICSYVGMDGKWNKTFKIAASAVLLCTVISPLISFIGNADLSFSHVGSDYEISFEDSELYESAQSAFCDGIRKHICDSFSLSETDVSVFVFGFDALKMRAERIRVVLHGAAVFADSRAIAEKIASADLGECEVEIGGK